MVEKNVNMTENGCTVDDVEIYHVYAELQTSDEKRRSRFLQGLDHSLKELADGKKVKDAEESPSASLKRHLPIILRLSYDVPFPDVREQCTKIIQELEVSWYWKRGSERQAERCRCICPILRKRLAELPPYS